MGSSFSFRNENLEFSIPRFLQNLGKRKAHTKRKWRQNGN